MNFEKKAGKEYRKAINAKITKSMQVLFLNAPQHLGRKAAIEEIKQLKYLGVNINPDGSDLNEVKRIAMASQKFLEKKAY